MSVQSYFILIISGLLLAWDTSAQTLTNDTKTLKVLIFKNQKNEKTKMISQGARVKYKLLGDNKLRKGNLEDVKTGIMVVDGQEIPFDNCQMIAGRVSSDEILVGGIGLGLGTTSVVFGATVLSFISIPVAGVVVGAGLAIVGVGIYFISKSKRFKLTGNWEVHSGELEYNLVN